MRRKYKLRLGLLIVGLVLCLSGITYAYLRKSKTQTDKNIVSTINCLDVTFTNEEDVINLKNAFAISDNDALINVKPYKFTLKNTCPNSLQVDINLESLQVENQLDKRYLKVYLNNEEMNNPIISIVDILEDREAITSGATSDNITSTSFKGYEEKEFELKLWIDYNTTAEDGMNKYYEGKIALNISPKPDFVAIYGVRRDIDSESSAWERTHNSVGLVANAQFGETPVQNDFDSIYPWSAIDTYSYDPTTKKEISLKRNGIDIFPFEGKHGEILTRIPEFYYRRYQQTESDGKTYEYIQISAQEVEGFTKSEQFSVGRYTMSGNSSAVHSRSGVQPLTNTTITDFRTYAKKLGSDFGQLDYRYFILQLLYLVEYADYNSQVKIGRGNTANSSGFILSGGCNNLGMKSGTLNNDGLHSMIYRGIEDIFGNIMQYVDGINIQNYVTYICYNPNEYKVDTFTGCYQKIGYTNLTENNVYITKLGYDQNNPLISFPIKAGGSTTTYIPDLYWILSGNKTVLVGGISVSGSDAGLWAFYSQLDSSSIDPRMGARLLRYN